MLRDWHCPVCIEWPEIDRWIMISLVHSMVLVDVRGYNDSVVFCSVLFCCQVVRSVSEQVSECVTD